MPKSIQHAHSTNPLHTIPSLKLCGWKNHGESVRHAMANQTCQVVMRKTYCAPNRLMRVRIVVSAAMCIEGVMCDAA